VFLSGRGIVEFSGPKTMYGKNTYSSRMLLSSQWKAPRKRIALYRLHLVVTPYLEKPVSKNWCACTLLRYE